MTSKAKLSALLSTAASYGYDVRSTSLLGAVLSDLVERLPEDEAASAAPPLTVEVTLFKASGKFYTTEPWRIPAGAIGPYDMVRSPDFRRINGDGAVLIGSQEPWGFPHLFPAINRTVSSPPTYESRLAELISGGLDDGYAHRWAGVTFVEAARQAEKSSTQVVELLEAIDKLHEQARHSVRDNLDLRQTAVHAAATAAASVGEVSYDYWRSVAEAVIDAVLEVEGRG